MSKRANRLPIHAGTFISRDGTRHTFSEADVRDIVASYDPAKLKAPLVIGHPEHDSPAWGWVKQLAFNADGGIDYQAEGVMPEFSGWVNEGRWNQQSVALYPKDHEQNPTPGRFYLRHIGFLGAKPPAIKGYPCPSFAAGDAGVIEFSDWNGLTVAGLFRRIKNWMIESSGQEKADAVLPEWEIENLTVSAAQKEEPRPAFSETEGDGMTPEQIAAAAKLKADQETLARQQLEFAERDKKLKADEAAARQGALRAAAAGVVDGLVKEGKVLPALAAGAIAFMASMNSEALPEIEFSEGDKTVKKTNLQWFIDYLKAQPKVVEFAERGNQGLPASDLNAAELSKRAIEFQEAERAAGREISVTAAVTHVTQQLAQ